MSSPASRLAYGAYTPGLPADLTQLHALEGSLGSRLAIASSYSGWGDAVIDDNIRREVGAGYTPLISWDMGATSSTRFVTFTSGAHDAYLATVAAAARRLGRPVYLRPWPEMNADWTAFQPTSVGSRPAGGMPRQFVAAWRYLVTFFRRRGATNVRWVFNPTTDTYTGTTPVGTI